MRSGGLFVELNEVAECHRVEDIVGFGERIESQFLFEAGHENRDTERVEA